MTEQQFIPCRVKQLPPPALVEAAAAAVTENPANAPNLLGAAAASGVVSPQHLALLTAKYWGAGGVRLTVGFLDAPPAALRTRVISHMNAWAQSANVKFAETRQAARAQVRIARTPGDGYWSYLGTDILHVPAGTPTMNLDGFTMRTPESEFHRVVRHETGHTLGFPHEHMRRQIVQRIDPQKAVAYFGMTQGWSADMVQAQVLTPLEDAALTATPGADQVSIMCYSLPPSITRDGQPILGGADIDASDFAFAAKLYPKRRTH